MFYFSLPGSLAPRSDSVSTKISSSTSACLELSSSSLSQDQTSDEISRKPFELRNKQPRTLFKKDLVAKKEDVITKAKRKQKDIDIDDFSSLCTSKKPDFRTENEEPAVLGSSELKQDRDLGDRSSRPVDRKLDVRGNESWQRVRSLSRESKRRHE